MITAKNYAAQAEKDLISQLSHLKTSFPNDCLLLKAFIEILHNSIHFALPDHGLLFNDNFKGINNVEIHLPYNQITIEYFVPLTDKNNNTTDSIYVPKRLIVAIDEKAINLKQIISKLQNVLPKKNLFIMNEISKRAGIFVYSVNFIKNRWIPQSVGAIITRDWDNEIGAQAIEAYKISDQILSQDAKQQPIVVTPIVLLPEIFNLVYKDRPKETMHDISSDCSAVLELIEALSCRNVTTEPLEKIDPEVNKRRIKDGKLPLYETKILTIKTPIAANNKEKEGYIESRAAPRLHLRRGHIRRLPKGNIWINSCTVGKSENGIIEKSYKIT